MTVTMKQRQVGVAVVEPVSIQVNQASQAVGQIVRSLLGNVVNLLV
jgi:hypothetical protein